MALRKGSRYLMRGLAFAGVAAAGYLFGISSDPLAAQPAPQPGKLPNTLPGAVRPNAVPAQPQPEQDRRVVAFITVNNKLMPITREELGDFVIARGGHEKLELLVNRKIIDIEAARRGVTVTTTEIKAGLEEDLRSLGINRKDFEEQILPRYHKSLYEWVEDVIRPRILLTKMCKDRVKITDEDLQHAFENKFGEKRQARVICWNKTDLRAAEKQWAEARKSDEDFLRIAKTQAEPALAAGGGLVAPLGRYSEAADTKVEKILFSLKVGEMSELFKTEQGIMCVKLNAIIPPDKNAKLDDKMKSALRNELFQKRVEREIPEFFKQLKAAAKPNLILKGPPSTEEFREGVRNIVEQALPGGVPASTPPMPKRP